MDEEIELMSKEAKAMEVMLSDVIKSPFSAEPLIERTHAYIFVFDSSNKRTFQSMLCMLETIKELEKTKKKDGGLKSNKKKEGSAPYFPKMIVIGTKKDLKKQKEAGLISKDDVKQLEGTRIREVSSLTNQGISEAFKLLITDLDSDQVLQKEQERFEIAKKKKTEPGEEGEGEEDTSKPKDIKKEGAKAKSKGGFLMCCGPRTATGEESDGDDQDKASDDSEDSDDIVDLKKGEGEIKIPFAAECDSSEFMK